MKTPYGNHEETLANILHFIAQGVINVAEDHTTIEYGSKIHRAMEDLCEYSDSIQEMAKILDEPDGRIHAMNDAAPGLVVVSHEAWGR